MFVRAWFEHYISLPHIAICMKSLKYNGLQVGFAYIFLTRQSNLIACKLLIFKSCYL